MTPRRTIFLVVFIIVLFVALYSQDRGTTTTYSAKPGGVRATFDVLSRQSYPVQRWRQPFSELSNESGQALVVVEPSLPLSYHELQSWIEKGNTVVIFGFTSGMQALKSLDKDWRIDADAIATIELLLASPSTPQSVHCVGNGIDACPKDLKLSNGVYPKLVSTELTQPIVASTDEMIVSRTRLGAGELLVVFNHAIIQNEFIDLHDNLLMVLALLSNHKSILFDEFHHGYKPLAPQDTEAYVASLGLFVGLIVCSVGIAAMGRALRFGPPSVDVGQQVETIELATAVAMMLYEQKSHESLNRYKDAWKERFAKRLALPVHDDDEIFCKTLTRRGVSSVEDIREAMDVLSKSDASVADRTLEDAIATLENVYRSEAHV